ncbi:MAG: alanine--tRNA ligase [Lachnospiraceae bacterium]|nr:alanine--tRNA ligase [Lachnospiraceae bacterium]
MKKYGVNELRRMYLEFFESKDHLALPSFSLVPHNDNSLLLINAGMAPMKPWFTGAETPPRKRVTTCQKCIRTGDIENVGKTARHGTFFEMLGNFSFGDYFKREALNWSWEFLTQVVGLDPDRLYPSVYMEDDEAYDIWNKEIGIPAERIYRFGKEDNFWEHGAGPCGPCSEIYYDRGEKYGCGKPDCAPGCDCDRYMEVWNDVFTQFENDGHGNYTELAQKNIDTGMGLERLAVACQDVDSMFDIDTIVALRDKVCEFAKTSYHDDEKKDVSIRRIVDHIRSSTFMISDGIMPTNEGRGYVLRRLIRGAARHGRLLGIDGAFLSELSKTVIETSKDGYPELGEKSEFIFKVLSQEEENFDRTIDQGLSILTDLEKKMTENGTTVLDGQEAFTLYDTYGFPLDLTKEILEEKGYTVDQDRFDACMKEQRERARAARKTTNYMGADATVYDELPVELTSEFDGYDHLSDSSKITAIAGEEEITQALTDGEKGTIVVDVTPFYGTMGGQVGDKGTITGPDGEFKVEDTIHLRGGKIGHVGTVVRGMLKTGDEVSLCVSEDLRKATARNHSATHLCQKALKEVLGAHVEQKGSYVDPFRLRFDFSHFQAMTADELRQVEDMVNQKIEESIPVVTEVMSLDEAKKTGAMALFGEKYGEEVRVVEMGEFSKELCGGTHVSNTSQIKNFKILSEAGVAAGVRRIEALTGDNVIRYYREMEQEVIAAASMLKTSRSDILEKISALQSELKEAHSQIESLKSEAAKSAMGDVSDNIREIAGVKFIASRMEGVDANGLRELGDSLKEKIGEGVIVLASVTDGKVQLMATATEGVMKRGAHAGNLIKGIAKLVGGGGGGRPNMAMAGGKDASGVDAALAEAEKVLEQQLG